MRVKHGLADHRRKWRTTLERVMDQTRRPLRRRVRQMLLASVLAVAAVGPTSSPARADSIDDKRRQAAAIADQLDQIGRAHV